MNYSYWTVGHVERKRTLLNGRKIGIYSGETSDAVPDAARCLAGIHPIVNSDLQACSSNCQVNGCYCHQELWNLESTSTSKAAKAWLFEGSGLQGELTMGLYTPFSTPILTSFLFRNSPN
jgi:hypothetical protein